MDVNNAIPLTAIELIKSDIRGDLFGPVVKGMFSPQC